MSTGGSLLVSVNVQGTYTQRFSARHQLYGHLFQGRYKALNVDERDRRHFQVISTYIHLNPVRAGLIRGEGEPLKAYRWSSYPAYLLPPRKRVAWLRVDRVMGSLGLGADDAPGCVGTRPPRAVGSLSV